VIRALVSIVTFVLATIMGSLISLVAGVIDRSGDLVMATARVWSRIVLRVPGVVVETKTDAVLDPKRPYVFMPNHASMVDIWAMFVAVPVQFRFIAKKQLGAIPLFGWAMRAGRFIFIDRQNAVSARRSIDEAAKRIQSGQSVVIFPEGTRTRDGKLGPFKKGGFHLAVDSGADIVPVAIRGTHEVMPRGSALIRAGKVSLELGTPIPTAGLGPHDRDALMAKVRGEIARMLGESVDHPNERQPLRRRGHAADGAVAARKHARDGVLGQPAAADVDQRADDDADHVLEESGRLDLERQLGAVAGDVQPAHEAVRRPAVAVRGAEGREVVFAHQRDGSAPDRIQIDRLAHVPGAPQPQRRAHGVAEHPVTVDLPLRGEPRVEVGRRLGDVDDGQIGRQHGVEPAQQAQRGDADAGGLERQARDLSVGVDTRVGTAGGAHENALAGHLADRVLQGGLDRALPALLLPAGEVGAVVLDDDAQLAAQNSSSRPSDHVESPRCILFAVPRPEMSA
jgi:1-acyl-sn-glycerol-3-phosphate acyltransferase